MIPELIAVDVGNSRVKWGLFCDGMLTQVTSLPLNDRPAFDRQLTKWGRTPDAVGWAVASVNVDGSETLIAWLRAHGIDSPIVLDDPGTLPLRVLLARPTAVGMDRLLDAVAVNVRRPPGRPAVIVDAGSAITVDAVSGQGEFLGGTIAPGIGLAARALHEFTYWLPLVGVSSPPDPIGKTTEDAMSSGLYWGTVGSVKELVRRVSLALGSVPAVYVTGGDAGLLAPHLEPAFELVPNLTLMGIHLAYQHVRSERQSGE